MRSAALSRDNLPGHLGTGALHGALAWTAYWSAETFFGNVAQRLLPAGYSHSPVASWQLLVGAFAAYLLIGLILGAFLGCLQFLLLAQRKTAWKPGRWFFACLRRFECDTPSGRLLDKAISICGCRALRTGIGRHCGCSADTGGFLRLLGAAIDPRHQRLERLLNGCGLSLAGARRLLETQSRRALVRYRSIPGRGPDGRLVECEACQKPLRFFAETLRPDAGERFRSLGNPRPGGVSALFGPPGKPRMPGSRSATPWPQHHIDCPRHGSSGPSLRLWLPARHHPGAP